MYNEVERWMQRYNPDDLLLWIQTTAVHPANQMYQIRFEFLLGVLFSINRLNFKGERLGRNAFEDFIQNFDRQYGTRFMMVEDWKQFDQSSLIPFIAVEQKFNFFYANLERPFEQLKTLNHLISAIETVDANIALKLTNVFHSSLYFQTKLLNKIILQNIEEKSDTICVPTQDFFDNISPDFSIESNIIIESLTINLGKFRGLNDRILNKAVEGSLYKSMYCCLSNGCYYLLPQLHIPILFYYLNQQSISHPQKKQLEEAIQSSLIKKVRYNSAKCFGLRRAVFKIIDAKGQDLAEKIDAIFRIKEDKLILIKTVKVAFNSDLSRYIQIAVKELATIIEEICKQEMVGLIDDSDEIPLFPISVLNIYGTIIFQCVDFDYEIDISRKFLLKNMWIFDSKDYFNLLAYVSSEDAFFNFLDSDRALEQSGKIFSASIMDRFAYYIENGEKFFKAGKKPDFIAFDPHQWHDFFHEKIYQKYQDDIFELLESRYDEDYFNHVHKIQDNVYEVFDSATLTGGHVVKLNNSLIWIKYPYRAIECTSDEVRIVSDLIGPLFSDYINKLKVQLSQLFQNYGHSISSGFSVMILPITYICRHKELNYLTPHLQEITKETPLKVFTRKMPNQEITSMVIYDMDYLQDLFGGTANDGERYCVKQLILSLINYFAPSLDYRDLTKIAEQFMEDNIPLSQKGYAYVAVRVENAQLENYRSPVEALQSDFNRVDTLVGEWLFRSGKKAGTYSGIEAKSLMNEIRAFLQSHLEAEIAIFNESIIHHAYQECEFIEGERVKSRIRAGMDASKYTEYDVVEEHLKKTHKISDLATSAKHILLTILKVGIKGSQAITEAQWRYLQAIAISAHEATLFSDFIHFDIAPCRITLSDMFEIEYEKDSTFFDHNQYMQKQGEINVETAKASFVQRIMESRSAHEEKTGINSWLEEIDQTFLDKFRFSFVNLIQVLYCIGVCSDSEKSPYFPLCKENREALVLMVCSNTIDNIDSAQVNKIIDFISLDFTTYECNEDIMTTKMLRRKERINLCPLIQIEKDNFLYGKQMSLCSMHLWVNNLSSADFPYYLDDKDNISILLAKLHKELDRKLEIAAESKMKAILGANNVEATIDNFRRISAKFPSKPSCGEIDILAVNPDTTTIFVLDAKNVKKKILPADIRREIRKFTEYTEKLISKAQFIEENMEEILLYFKADIGKEWRIKTAFVVDYNYPAAYIKDNKVDFVMMDEIEKYVT